MSNAIDNRVCFILLTKDHFIFKLSFLSRFGYYAYIMTEASMHFIHLSVALMRQTANIYA